MTIDPQALEHRRNGLALVHRRVAGLALGERLSCFFDESSRGWRGVPAWSERWRVGKPSRLVSLLLPCGQNSFLNLAGKASPPSLAGAGLAVGTNTFPRIFEVGVASTGHRGRVDARGRRDGLGTGSDANDTARCRRFSSRRTLAQPPASVANVSVVSCLALRACARERGTPARGPKARASSSITRRSVGVGARRSRQARCLGAALAAGTDAASMARQCQTHSPQTTQCICPNRQADASGGGWGILPGEVKEEPRRRPAGDTSREGSPTLRRHTKPACNADTAKTQPTQQEIELIAAARRRRASLQQRHRLHHRPHALADGQPEALSRPPRHPCQQPRVRTVDAQPQQRLRRIHVVRHLLDRRR
jgi:hypothetical protein